MSIFNLKMYAAAILACGLMLAACQQRGGGAAEQADVHTYSNAAAAVVQHLDLDIKVSFEHKQISGIATWHIANMGNANEIVFDTKDLRIDSVYVDGKKVATQLGSADAIMGAALSIPIAKDSKRLSIYYASGSAEALQWLDAAQTFGKKQPYLYTQCEPILARSWIPCQDGPGIRFTYNAKVQVPAGLMALMSAENPQERNAEGKYSFKMDQPIPAYLLALAVGDIDFRAEGPRTGVYAEPAIIDKAAKELSGLEAMVDTAEALYGPYRWGRYDVLILPLGFPIGGMENPRLTFATPTILAGDKSLVNLISHELAHSWSGNLVTNKSWDQLWLNEGFTVYFERRITEKLNGKAYVDMLWTLGRQDLDAVMARLGPKSPDTRLKLDLKGRDPGIGLTDVAYEKGALMLRLMEQTVGRERFDKFLNQYFEHFAFKTVDTKEFIDFANKNLLDANEEWKRQINLDNWIYQPGLPANAPHADNARFAAVDTQRATFLNTGNAMALRYKNWSTHEWLYFLRGLPADMALAKMQELDDYFSLSRSTNSEIADQWYLLALQTHYKAAYPAMKTFLLRTGRQKFLEPLYMEMMKSPEGATMAKEIFEQSKHNYHPIAQQNIAGILRGEAPVE